MAAAAASNKRRTLPETFANSFWKQGTWKRGSPTEPPNSNKMVLGANISKNSCLGEWASHMRHKSYPNNKKRIGGIWASTCAHTIHLPKHIGFGGFWDILVFWGGDGLGVASTGCCLNRTHQKKTSKILQSQSFFRLLAEVLCSKVLLSAELRLSNE